MIIHALLTSFPRIVQPVNNHTDGRTNLSVMVEKLAIILRSMLSDPEGNLSE